MLNGIPHYTFSDPYYIVTMGGVSRRVDEWIALERENAELRGALAYYAMPGMGDNGLKAREALSHGGGNG